MSRKNEPWCKDNTSMQAQTIVGLDQILQPQFQGATYWAAVVSPGQCSCSNHCFWKRALRKSAAGSPAWCQRSDSVHVPHMKSRRYKHCKHPRWVSTKSLPSSLEGLRTKKKHCIVPPGEKLKSSGAHVEVGG